MKRKWIWIGLSVPVVAAAVWIWAGRDRRQTEIVIVSTNDIHGAIDRMPSLATLVGRLRSENEHVLLVDAGDKWTGNPYVDLCAEPGRPVVDLMNDLRYDVATVGNHGFDNGGRELDTRIRDGRFPTVLANLRSDSAFLRSVPPYVIETVGPVRIGFLGLTDNSRHGYPDGSPENFTGLHFSDPIPTAENYRFLADSCDILVGLTHIGEQQDSLLALAMPELDLIIGGHTHTLTPEGRRIGGVLVTQAGKSLQYAGVARLYLTGGKLDSGRYELVRLDTASPDPQIASRVESLMRNPILEKSVGTVAADMDKVALVNFVTDAIAEATEADFAFVNWNGIRREGHPAGEFTAADLYATEPFADQVEMFTMRLADLRELLLNKFNEEGREGHVVDIYPSGGRYVIEIDGEGNGTGVRFYDRRGEPLPYDARTYRVAMSEYIGHIYDFTLRGRGRTTGVMITDMMEDYLRRHSPVTVSDAPRAGIEAQP